MSTGESLPSFRFYWLSRIGEKVSLAPQCQIYGPVRIDKNVFVGMQSLVFDAYIQEDTVIEPGAKIIGVTIPPKRFVSAGRVIFGSVVIGRNVFIGPFSSIRGDVGLKIFISHDCNIQDGVVLHGLKNYEYNSPVTEHSVFKDRESYSI
ncbi:hypothetical protein DT075_36470 [Bacillus licheniformis]|nr:hypothetical protein DT075_36470 [Bacillus licheniformis]